MININWIDYIKKILLILLFLDIVSLLDMIRPNIFRRSRLIFFMVSYTRSTTNNKGKKDGSGLDSNIQACSGYSGNNTL
jgi:hypothetical protein